MRWPLSQPEWHPLDTPQDGHGETDPMEDCVEEEETQVVRYEDNGK